MNNRLKSWLAGAAIGCVACSVATVVAQETNSSLRAGADLRLRQEYFDDIPLNNGKLFKDGENDYFRIRPRVWLEADPCDYATFRVRALSEYRIYITPDMTSKPQVSSYEFPDELLFDNLYLDLHKLASDTLDLRIGRQDLSYGTGKVVADGTAGDGSRTTYFNGLKAVWRGLPNSTLDVFGFSNPSHDPLASDLSGTDLERDLNQYPKAKNDVREQGAGIYLKNKTNPKVPCELYGIFKQEGDWNQTATTNSTGAYLPPTYAWQTLDSANGVVVNPEVNIGTVGFRVAPEFAPELRGNLEVAGQFGEHADTSSDVQGYMVDASLAYQLPMLTEFKPTIEPWFYYLSGDDPATADDEGWNPLWARYTSFSDLLSYTFDGSRWSNMMLPALNLYATLTRWLKLSGTVGYLGALEDDGPGDGKSRGIYSAAKAEFALGQELLLPKDKLTAHACLQTLDPGDYYTVEDTAVFARWELVYSF